MVQKLLFGIVSRFLGISCDILIFSVLIDINIVNNFGISRYRYHAIYFEVYNKKEKEAGKERKQRNETKTIMHWGSRPSRGGIRLVFAGGTISPVMCPSDGQQKDDKREQAEDNTRKEQRQGFKAKRRPQQGDPFSKKSFLPGVLWWSGVISHDISRSMVI